MEWGGLLIRIVCCLQLLTSNIFPIMKKCCFNENLDRMSYLPDAIQSHIVSFLPMKDAMRTSILSKQWKNICSSLSQLEFNQSDFNNKENTAAVFKDFVDKMVIRHDGSDIKSFSINTILDDIFILSRRVSTWISFAIQHNVQDLKLWIQYGELEKLPCEFFTCSTIRVLNLANIHIDWPKIIRFPLLKSLYIESLTFNNDNTVDKLFSSSACPMLEDLEIQSCRVNAHTLSICNPSLKSIYIFDADRLNINISASSLWKLDCIWCEPPNITSETLSSLCNGYFDFYNRGSCTAAMITSQFNCVSKILMGLRNVETLTLSSSFILFLSRGRALLPASLPSSYCSLKHLNLQLFPTSIHVQLMKLLLRSYPNLQNLQICIDRKEYNWHLETLTSMDVTDHVEENWQLKELPLGDMLNCLRIVEIKDFEGSESEVSLVRYLLENAKFLEKMNINYENSIQQSAGSHTPKSEMLSTFARVASNATIMLS